jgi:uncharacterized protein YndB with AHSA1/START domain
MTEAEGRKHEFEIALDAPIEAVWEAIASGEGLARWFALEARVTPGEGGNVWASWGSDCEGESPISVWDPPHRLQTPFGPQMVDWYLESVEGKTIVRLVHSGISADSEWDAEYDSTRTGWALFMRNLEYAMGKHVEKSCVTRLVWVPREGPLEEVWAKLFAADGFGIKGDQVAGSTFKAETTIGWHFDGTVDVWDPPLQFAGTISGLDDALFCLMMNYDGSDHVTAELRFYGHDNTFANTIADWFGMIMRSAYHILPADPYAPADA